MIVDVDFNIDIRQSPTGWYQSYNTKSVRIKMADTEGNTRIKLNVGGTMFQTYRSTLTKFPGSKLAKLEMYGEHYNSEDNAYFFDRNPAMFAHIIDAYRKGTVHVPRDVCGITFKHELEFWEISPAEVASCCWQTLYQSEEDVNTVSDLVKYYLHNTNYRMLNGERKSLRERVWLFLDEPVSSVPSMIWGIFMTMIVLIVILTDCLMTLPELTENYNHDEDQVVLSKLSDIMGYDNSTNNVLMSMKPNSSLIYTSGIGHFILTIEFIVTFIICPNKSEFLKSIVRNIVLVGYVSYWACFILERNMHNLNIPYLSIIYLILKHLTVFEVFRLFYISKNVPSFHVIGVTFSSSRQELTVLFSILGILVIIFSKFILYVEIFYSGKIQNAFQAMYWALITLTTVGYGDYIPATTGGHVVACACALCGLLVLSMPVGVIASTFYTFFNFRKYAHKHFKRYSSNIIKLESQCSPSLTTNAEQNDKY